MWQVGTRIIIGATLQEQIYFSYVIRITLHTTPDNFIILYIAGLRHVLRGEVILEQWLPTQAGPLAAEAIEKLKSVQNEVNLNN